MSWNDETDLSEYELWNNGLEPEQSADWNEEEIAPGREIAVREGEHS